MIYINKEKIAVVKKETTRDDTQDNPMHVVEFIGQAGVLLFKRVYPTSEDACQLVGEFLADDERY